MELDSAQTRRFFLAGTAAFPQPFPSLGDIWIHDGSFLLRRGERPKAATFVIVREKSDREQATRRVARLQDVAAIFFAGVRRPPDQQNVLQYTEATSAYDFEKGEWFLDDQVDPHEISTRLSIDIRDPDSGARGIIFVHENRPVLTIAEFTQTARAAVDYVPAQPRCECPDS